MLFETGHVRHLRSFSNERFIFEGVHHAFKFCLVIFARGGSTTEFEASFRINPPEAVAATELEHFLEDPSCTLMIAWPLVQRLSPDSLSVMEFKHPISLQIAQKMLRFPLLGQDVEGKWKLSLYREFDMTNDSDCFQSQPGPDRLRLFEGKMIHYYQSDFEKPRYWVAREDAVKRLAGSKRYPSNPWAFDRPRFAHRSIGRNVDSRTLICTVLPPHVVCGHSLNIDIGITDSTQTLFLIGTLATFVFDFALRQQVSANLTMNFLYQTPAPRLTAGEPGYAEIVERAAKLICTNPDFDELAHEAGLSPPNHRGGVADPTERAKLRSELEAMVAHSYRLNEDEFAYILSTFPVVPEDIKQAAFDEFIRMRESGEAAVFNPDLAKPAAGAVDPAKAMKDLIAAGESALIEFKSSARWDVKNSKPEKFIERIIVKTVAALLNTDGGTLVIGVEDDGQVYGLAEDYKLSGGKGRDSFENWLTQTLLKDFGKDAGGLLSTTFHELKTPEADKLGSGDVCVVTVKPSGKPRFVVEESKEVFYVRTGNATNSLKMSELLEYYKQRWPEVAATN